MTRRKTTDGERIVDGLFRALYGYGPYKNQRLSIRIDRLIRKRMAEAWAAGHEYGVVWGDLDANPYRRRKEP